MQNESFAPTEMEWTNSNCKCAENSYCIRPAKYGKPKMCLNNNIPLEKFLEFLVDPMKFIPGHNFSIATQTSPTITTTIQMPPTTTPMESNQTIESNKHAMDHCDLDGIYFLLVVILLAHVRSTPPPNPSPFSLTPTYPIGFK